MKSLFTLCALAALAGTLTACNQASAGNHDADVKALQDSETQWNQDYAAKDATKIASYYADGAVLMAPGVPAAVGKDAISKMIGEMVADPALSLKFQASKVDVAQSGDLAYTQGTYTLTFTDPQTKQVVHDHGSYVTDYRKQTDGLWKAVADIATSDVPPAPPAPTTAKKKH